MKASPAIRMIVASDVVATILPTASMIVGCVRLAYMPHSASKPMIIGPSSHSSVLPSPVEVIRRRGQRGQGCSHEREDVGGEAEVAPPGSFEQSLGVETGRHHWMISDRPVPSMSEAGGCTSTGLELVLRYVAKGPLRRRPRARLRLRRIRRA